MSIFFPESQRQWKGKYQAMEGSISSGSRAARDSIEAYLVFFTAHLIGRDFFHWPDIGWTLFPPDIPGSLIHRLIIWLWYRLKDVPDGTAAMKLRALVDFLLMPSGDRGCWSA
jgi:hypothetical protein